MNDLSMTEVDLQQQVRAFLLENLPQGGFEPGLGLDCGYDVEFSKLLAKQGWVGMSIPRRYGGQSRHAVDRFIVTEELLRWGAPVSYHWVADRQTAPVILRFGSEQQKERFLPPICRGEISFCIGMSETEAGSDLAAVRTRAIRAAGGWVLNGTKIWTSGAHHGDWIVVLCRTSTDEADRHSGLSQFMVDLRGDGVKVNTIPFLDGSARFGEVVLTEVFVPDSLVLGGLGEGWVQNTSELGYERGGPDRWLSTYGLLEAFIREHANVAPSMATQTVIGELTAKYWALRRLSLAISRKIDRNEAAAAQSALVKEMGTRFEQDVIVALHGLIDLEPTLPSDSLFERLLYSATLGGPSFTIRGGTIEILRSVASKGMSA